MGRYGKRIFFRTFIGIFATTIIFLLSIFLVLKLISVWRSSWTVYIRSMPTVNFITALVCCTPLLVSSLFLLNYIFLTIKISSCSSVAARLLI